MSKLYFEILNSKQQKVFAFLKEFSKLGVLGGGTALALQLKHRKSYDFDIFMAKSITKDLLSKIQKVFDNIKILVDSSDEISFIANGVKISFVYFPFPPLHKTIKTYSLPIFYWKDLILDKAYAIGRRSEYRDYVDIFFTIKRGYKLKNIIGECKKKFGGLFSEKLFLQQLVYLKDIRDFSAEFLKEKYNPKEIKNFFKKAVKEYFKKT